MNTRKTGIFGFLIAALIALVAFAAPATAGAKDRNGDRIPDKWEKKQKLSLKKDQRKLDQDRDGLRNRGEWLAGTKPRDKDSDNDGESDDDEYAGVIASYNSETEVLKITLFGGGEISGQVTDRTEIECDSDSADHPGNESHGKDDSDDRSSKSGRDDDDDNGDDDESDHDSDDDDHDSDDRNDRDDNCSASELIAGVEVDEAEVKYTGNGPVFTEIELE